MCGGVCVWWGVCEVNRRQAHTCDRSPFPSATQRHVSRGQPRGVATLKSAGTTSNTGPGLGCIIDEEINKPSPSLPACLVCNLINSDKSRQEESKNKKEKNEEKRKMGLG